MSFSSTVDYRYRLVASDLGGRTRTVMVTRVSYQGVENLQPMLHLESIAKPLALDATQRLVVSQIARSTAVSDWVGLMMDLHPMEDGRGSWIEITPVGSRRQKARSDGYTAELPRRPAQARKNEEPLPAPVNNKVRTRTESAQEAGAVAASKTTLAAKATSASSETPEPTPSASWFNLDDLPQTSILTPILLGILVVAAFVLVYQLETNEAAWQWFSGLFGI